ncbi:MAG: hypothetical protein V4507_00635 [Verrucomicrobiota bacterium]
MKNEWIKAEDLLKEKTLWQIYKAAWKISDSIFNWIVGVAVVIFFIAYVVLEKDILRVHCLLLKLADIGFNAAISLLGFLIAGFTIISSLADPKLFLFMINRTHEDSGLSYLKYNFFTLIRTFICFLVFAAFQLTLIAFVQRSSMGAVILEIAPNLRETFELMIRWLLVISAGLWVFAFLQLKSFIFNVYHFVMTMIRYEAKNHNEELKLNGTISSTIDLSDSNSDSK